jgi:nucleoid-associated protein YgaU
MSVATEFPPIVVIPARARAGADQLSAAPEPWCEPLEVEAPPRLASVSVLARPGEVRPAAPLRLTRRGVAVLAMAVVALGIALVWLAAGSAPNAAPAPAAPRAVTVQSGDTLWSIASRVAPQRDPRAEVAALQRANHLRDTQLAPGQILRVP